MSETVNESPESTEANRPSHWYKPGQSGNPAGRPKGARHKFGEAFLEDMYSAWKRRGPEAIEKVINDKPHEFLRVAASILPRHLTISDDSDISHEQRLALFKELIGRLEASGFIEADAGTIEGTVRSIENAGGECGSGQAEPVSSVSEAD